MALTISGLINQAALNGIGALFNSGSIVLCVTTGTSGLATLTFASTAFAGASTAQPSLNVSNTLQPDTSVTTGTIAFAEFRQTGSTSPILVAGVSTAATANLVVTSNVVPTGATEVSCPAGITLSLALSS